MGRKCENAEGYYGIHSNLYWLERGDATHDGGRGGGGGFKECGSFLLLLTMGGQGDQQMYVPWGKRVAI
jgi:hypothetical protein